MFHHSEPAEAKVYHFSSKRSARSFSSLVKGMFGNISVNVDDRSVTVADSRCVIQELESLPSDDWRVLSFKARCAHASWRPETIQHLITRSNTDLLSAYLRRLPSQRNEPDIRRILMETGWILFIEENRRHPEFENSPLEGYGVCVNTMHMYWLDYMEGERFINLELLIREALDADSDCYDITWRRSIAERYMGDVGITRERLGEI